MLKKYLFIILIMISSLGHADETITMNQWWQNAVRCTDLNCANQQIDRIDKQITALLGERLAYAKRSEQLRKVILGARNPGMSHTLPFVQQQALQMGYPPIFARNIFSTIVIQTNYYVQQR